MWIKGKIRKAPESTLTLRIWHLMTHIITDCTSYTYELCHNELFPVLTHCRVTRWKGWKDAPFKWSTGRNYRMSRCWSDHTLRRISPSCGNQNWTCASSLNSPRGHLHQLLSLIVLHLIQRLIYKLHITNNNWFSHLTFSAQESAAHSDTLQLPDYHTD